MGGKIIGTQNGTVSVPGPRIIHVPGFHEQIFNETHLGLGQGNDKGTLLEKAVTGYEILAGPLDLNT